MFASTVIADTTETLKKLLEDFQQPKDSFDVTLTSPAEVTISQNMKPEINLFLFRVTENQHSKNQHWQPVGDDRLRYPPLALNLLFVMTPFAEETLDEHRVFGEAMRIFHENGIIPADILQGTLANSTEDMKIDLCQFDLEHHTRIWNALNKPFRLSVGYEVRIALIDALTERDASRVLEKQIEFSSIQGENS